MTASSFLWYGMMRWAFEEMRSLDVSMPRDSNMSSSSSSTLGSMTVPDAITGTACGYMTPLGVRERANFCSPMTMV